MQKRAEFVRNHLLSVQFDPFAQLLRGKADALVYDYTLVRDGPIDGLHHHDAVEVGYCICGTGVFWVDGEMLPFSAPCVSVLYPGQLHKARATCPEGSQWVFVTFRAESLFSPISQGFELLPAEQADPGNALLRQEEVLALGAMMERELHAGETGWESCVKGLLAAILIRHARLPRRAASQGILRRNALVRLAPLLQDIDQNYARNMDAVSLAKQLHVHPATLREWFREAMGISTMQYVHRVRISAACSLLRGTERGVSQVAAMVGYSSFSAFNRHFRALMGCCPTEYRYRKEE